MRQSGQNDGDQQDNAPQGGKHIKRGRDGSVGCDRVVFSDGLGNMPLHRRHNAKVEDAVVTEDRPDQCPVTVGPISQVMHEKRHQQETGNNCERHSNDSEPRAMDHFTNVFHNSLIRYMLSIN